MSDISVNNSPPVLEIYLGRILKCIEDIHRHFSEENDAQYKYVYNSLTKIHHKKGTNPFIDLSHRIELENHDLFILMGYISLVKNLLKSPQNRMNYFSLRTLIEIGVDKVNISYAHKVSEKNRSEYKLYDTLSNLLGVADPIYAVYFLKLLNEERDNIAPEILILFEEAETLIKFKKNIKQSLIGKIRRTINNKSRNYTDRVKVPALLRNKTKIDPLRVVFSHLIHGNYIMVNMSFDPRFAAQHRNHVLALIWYTGLNVLIQTNRLVKDKVIATEINVLLQEAEHYWNIVLKG